MTISHIDIESMQHRIEYLERENAAQAEMLRVGRERAERLTEMIEQGIQNFNALAHVTNVIAPDDTDYSRFAVRTEWNDLVCAHCSAMLRYDAQRGLYCPKCTVIP